MSGLHSWRRGLDLKNRPRDVVGESGPALDLPGPDDLRYGLRISVWLRWFVVFAWLAQLHYRVNFAHPAYVAHTLSAVLLLALNGYVHYRIRTKRTTTWRWALALSAMDAATLTGGLVIAGGFANTFFVLYYPALAMFAVVFTSLRLSFAAVTLVAVVYASLSLVLEPGVDFEIKEEKVLFTRIIVMYAVVGAVNLVSRFERIRRIEAVKRERGLQRERIELSQTIHDTIAQSAYLIGLGLETAIELVGTQKRDELSDKLRATHALVKSTMWELRHPIDIGHIFEGRGPGPGTPFARLDLCHNHVDPRRGGPVRQGAASSYGYPAIPLFHNSQRHDERASPLQRHEGRHLTELRYKRAPFVHIGRRGRPPRGLRRSWPRFQEHGGGCHAHGRQPQGGTGRVGARHDRDLRDPTWCDSRGRLTWNQLHISG